MGQLAAARLECAVRFTFILLRHFVRHVLMRATLHRADLQVITPLLQGAEQISSTASVRAMHTVAAQCSGGRQPAGESLGETGRRDAPGHLSPSVPPAARATRSCNLPDDGRSCPGRVDAKNNDKHEPA